jgi:hypothetical protein
VDNTLNGGHLLRTHIITKAQIRSEYIIFWRQGRSFPTVRVATAFSTDAMSAKRRFLKSMPRGTIVKSVNPCNRSVEGYVIRDAIKEQT